MLEYIKKASLLAYSSFIKISLGVFMLAIVYFSFIIFVSNWIVFSILVIIFLILIIILYKYRYDILIKIMDLVILTKIFLYNIIYTLIYTLNLSNYSEYILPFYETKVYKFSDNIKNSEVIKIKDSSFFLLKLKGIIEEESLDNLYLIRSEEGHENFIFIFRIEKKLGKNPSLTKFIIKIVDSVIDYKSNKIYKLNRNDKYNKVYNLREDKNSFSVVIKWNKN